MTGSPTVLLLATAGITLLLAPGLALFFGGRPDRRPLRAIAVAIPTSMLLATVCWMLLGSQLEVAAFQGSLVATAVTVVLSVGLRTGHVRGYAVFCALWVVLVLVPVGYALFDVVRGPLSISLGTLDFGGASIVALCTGTAGIALALVSRGLGNAVGSPPRRSTLAYLFSGVASLIGWLAVDIGAELVIDSTTVTIAANGLWATLAGTIAWTVAQVINVHRATAAGVVAGAIAGSIVVLPASPWLDSTSVVILGLAAGVLGHVAAVGARRGGIGAWATLVGVCLVPGAIGLIGAGLFAHGDGLVFSGHIDLLSGQLAGLVIVVGYSLVVSLVLALAVDRTLRLVGSSRFVDETIVRLYREANAHDTEALLERMHPKIEWPSGWEGDFARGTEALRSYLMREWSQSTTTVTPLRSHRVRGKWIEVDVRHIARDSSGSIVSDRTLVHAYRERDGLFDRMEVR